MTAPEPYARYYNRNFYRATWILTALDAGFFTAANIKPKFLRDVASLLFSIYYLFCADKADYKVRRLRATPTVQGLRMSWEKQKHPLFRAISRIGLPRITYMYHNIVVPRRSTSYGYNPADPRTHDISCFLFFNGSRQAFPRSKQLLLQYPGGGFVCMDPACHEDYLTLWANMSPNTVVLSVDYGKAPEYPYPYAVEECYELYRLLRETNGACIGLEGWDSIVETENYTGQSNIPTITRTVKRKLSIKIIIVGDSAGGSIAATVTTCAVENSKTLLPPDALILIYPNLNFDLACWMSPQQIHLLRVESFKHVNALIEPNSNTPLNGQSSSSYPLGINIPTTLPQRIRSSTDLRSPGGRMATSAGSLKYTDIDRDNNGNESPLKRKKSFYEMANGALQSLRTQIPYTVFDEYGGSGLAHTYLPLSPRTPISPNSQQSSMIKSSDILDLEPLTQDRIGSESSREYCKKSSDLRPAYQHLHDEGDIQSFARAISSESPLPPAINSALAMTSRMSYFNDRVLTPELMRAVALCYLGPSPICPNIHDNYHLSPLTTPDAILARFPKVYILCGEMDPLVDDTVIFAGRLREAKMSQWRTNSTSNRDAYATPMPKDSDIVEVTILEGVSHGLFQMLPFLPEAANAVKIVASWFIQSFNNDPAYTVSSNTSLHDPRIVGNNLQSTDSSISSNLQSSSTTNASINPSVIPGRNLIVGGSPIIDGKGSSNSEKQGLAGLLPSSMQRPSKSKFLVGEVSGDSEDNPVEEQSSTKWATFNGSLPPRPSHLHALDTIRSSGATTPQLIPRSVSAHQGLLNSRDNVQMDQSLLLNRRHMQLSYNLLGEEATHSQMFFGQDNTTAPLENSNVGYTFAESDTHHKTPIIPLPQDDVTNTKRTEKS